MLTGQNGILNRAAEAKEKTEVEQKNAKRTNKATKENKKYNLKNDIIFKAFFSRKGNEIFLIDFLEALLNIKIESIKIKEEVNIELQMKN